MFILTLFVGPKNKPCQHKDVFERMNYLYQVINNIMEFIL